jgi:hypothetical protein
LSTPPTGGDLDGSWLELAGAGWKLGGARWKLLFILVSVPAAGLLLLACAQLLLFSFYSASSPQLQLSFCCFSAAAQLLQKSWLEGGFGDRVLERQGLEREGLKSFFFFKKSSGPVQGHRLLYLMSSRHRRCDLKREGHRRFDLKSEGHRRFDLEREGHRRFDLKREGHRRFDLKREGHRLGSLPGEAAPSIPRPERAYCKL